MRTPLAGLLAVATSCAVVAGAALAGPAVATGGVQVPTPLPSVSVPTPGLPAPSLPVPTPAVPSLPDAPTPPGGGDAPKAPGTGGGGNDGGSDGAGTASDAPGPAGATEKAADERAERKTAAARKRAADAATPMVAGTAAARDLLDDESSPELLAASQAFLEADLAIDRIARQKRLAAELGQQAEELSRVYRAAAADVVTARSAAADLHERYEAVRANWVSGAVEAYVSGVSSSDGPAEGLADALARLSDGSARADLRLGTLLVQRDAVRAELDRVLDRRAATRAELRDARKQLKTLAAQRQTALDAIYAARGSDVSLHQARLVESGQLGAQIRERSALLERNDATVQGTGNFARPLEGHVTSPFGMRLHPILRYRKLHTGTDLAGGSTILAADDGRVIMTVASTAYGNFTVIDHGVIDGRRVTTAYAHQAAILVREGQEVAKGDQIGVVGSTGYSTGPHLHFEVREDGTVVDPITWLG